MAATDRPVVVLGAGVHGVAIARELVLQHIPVVLVEAFDIAAGATAKSSRLIHGGLRYLEYGDLGLVRESLAERQRLLETAPYFVRPLRLHIPVRHDWSGLVQSAIGFFGLRRSKVGQWMEGPPRSRGYWPIRMGLNTYDWLSGSSSLPPSAAVSLDDPGVPQIDRRRYRGMLSYSDGQMRYPERFVFALLADAVQAAAAQGTPFAVRTRTLATIESGAVVLRSQAMPGSPAPNAEDVLSAALVINATGAWGDRTLQGLHAEAPPLFGGTKGSHFLTWHESLRKALRGQAVYAEADDGRLVFVLPFDDAVLVGTTDDTYAGPPEDAAASEPELRYLLESVNAVFGLSLARGDVAVHYSGVRPLPRPQGGSNAGISRDHSLVWNRVQTVPVLTLVGGKLTTWRAFAEEAVTQVLGQLHRPRLAATATRGVPGNEALPPGFEPNGALWRRWAMEYGSTPEEVAALWPLYGTQLCAILAAIRDQPRRMIADAPWSTAVVAWIIRHEWVTRLEDLVERRLMSVFARTLTLALLRDLAECLIATGVLPAAERDAEVARSAERLQRLFGRTISESPLWSPLPPSAVGEG